MREYLKLNPARQKVQLLGEKNSHNVLTNQIRHLIASLPLLIEKMKMENYCFQRPLTFPDLMVDEFGHLVIAEGVILEKVTRAGLSRAYHSGASVIKEIVGHPVPADIHHLISKMEMRKTHRYLILVHPSLIALQFRSQAYLDAHDILCANKSESELTALLRCLKESLNQWDHTVTNNDLLKHFFKQVAKSTVRLFKNLRNLECHALEHQKTETLGMYTKNQVRILSLCKFPKALPSLYWVLWNKKLLTELEIEDYFCSPGWSCCRIGFCLRKQIRLRLHAKKVNCNS